MHNKLLLSTALLTTCQSNVLANSMFSATVADEFATSFFVYLMIIVVYGLYWMKQKT